MGFCYPGKGESGDLPPRLECAETWMAPILEKLPKRKITLLIGQYAQGWFLKSLKKATLTETVKKLENLSARVFCFATPVTAQ
jgi:uracil-DNA glycosylase